MLKLFISILYSILILFSSCAIDKEVEINPDSLEKIIKTYRSDSINVFILEKVKSNTVVLLGEIKHNQGIYRQNVIEFLNYWVGKTGVDKACPRKICLILEAPTQFGKKLEDFFNDGKISDLFYDPHYILNMTVADLEFYYDLKDLIERVKKLNNNRFSKNPIGFKLICPEKDIPMLASREFRDQFFKTERDIFTATQIKSRIRELPDYKFLGVFGGFHILKKRSSDNIPRLANQLIKDGIKVYTIYRSLITENPFHITFNSSEKSFVIPLNVLDSTNLDTKSDLIDAWIFYNGSYFDDLIVINIPSVNVLHDHINYAKKYPEFYLAPLYGFWSRFTREKVPHDNIIEFIESRIGIDEKLAIHAIYDMSLFENIFEAQRSWNLSPAEINKVAANLTGFSKLNAFFSPPDDSTSSTFWKQYINKNENKVKLRLLTAVLYYGTRAEQNMASKRLKQLTGKNFSKRKDWLNWYRKMHNSITE